MQLDMHFYGIYALARAAGIKPETAKKIANASQFVDDAIEDEAIEIEDEKAVLPTMTSHKPIDFQNAIPGDQWKIWVPFHFIPGNDKNANTFIEKMVCKKDSLPARNILEHALQFKEEIFGPHLIGITAHAYADTFAHYGFIGLNRDYNKVNFNSIDIDENSKSIKKYIIFRMKEFKAKVLGTLAETLPVGHAAVFTFPDRPYLKWGYEYEDIQELPARDSVTRNNVNDFMEACEKLYNFFRNFVSNNQKHGEPFNPIEWVSISDKIRDIITFEGPKEERCDKWKKAISSNKIFNATENDKSIAYYEKAWKSAKIIYHFAQDKSYEDCDGCMYFKAAWKHRNYVINELLPSVGLFVGEEVS